MSILAIASNAISVQCHELSQSAERLARPANIAEDRHPPDPVREAETRIEAGAAIKANMAVIRNENERLGFLLDVLA